MTTKKTKVETSASAKPTQYTFCLDLEQNYTTKKDGVLIETHAKPYSLKIHYEQGVPFGKLLANEINCLFDVLAYSALNHKKKQNLLKLPKPIKANLSLYINGEKFNISREMRINFDNLLGDNKKQLGQFIVLSIADPLGYVDKGKRVNELGQFFNETETFGTHNKDAKIKEDFWQLIKAENCETLFEKAHKKAMQPQLN